MDPIILFFSGLGGRKPKAKSLDGLEGAARAEALCHNLVVTGRIPGMAVTVLRDGKTVLEKGYGKARSGRKPAVDPHRTLFRVASISKCITAVALAKLVEQGHMALDDSFYKFVPDYPKKQFDFTIRQLASHTAGIRGYKGKEYALNRNWDIEEGTKLFKKEELAYIPGADFLYNSFDFVLLSLAIQRAADRPFEDYVKEYVLDPLGMAHTVPERYKGKPAKVQRKERATAYTRSGSGFRPALPVNNAYKLAGGGYLSTSADIARLGQAVLEERVVDPDLMQEFLTPQLVLGKSTYYGLGWQASSDAQDKYYYGHVGNSVGAYTNFFVYPEEQLVVSILINSTDPKVQPELDAVVAAALSRV